MIPSLWAELHGASTHFPIALLLISAVFDLIAFLAQAAARRDLHAAGQYAIIAGALVSLPAVFSGLLMTKWDMLGHGALFWHHVFVWPAWALLAGLAAWRAMVGDHISRPAFAIYLAIVWTAAGLMGAAGYWGGQLILHS